MELADLLAPSRTAVVTSECQLGVLGGEAVFPALAEVAREAGLVAQVARLCAAARDAGVQVVHCTAVARDDRKGANTNARLFGAAAKAGAALLEGTEAAEVLPEIGVEREDLILARYHGLGPMGRTDLDPVLRNLGIQTVVVAGVSVNVAVTNLVMDAVNAGYQVVLPRDAVTGIPPAYADQVIDNTLGLLATITDVDAVADIWTTGS